MEKLYVLDTNVLLHDPMALESFNEHRIVLPMTVLEELDAIKDRRDKAVSREARIAIRAIDRIIGEASSNQIQEGVPIPNSVKSGEPGLLSIFPDQQIPEDSTTLYLDGSHHANDNRIINVALNLQGRYPDAYVCLVTKDINMRLKAKGSGLAHVEDYRKDRVLDDIDLLARGYIRWPGSFWSGVERVESEKQGRHTFHRLPRHLFGEVYPRMFIQDEQGFIGLVESVDSRTVCLRDIDPALLMGQKIWGLTPRNLEQGMALELLKDENNDMVVLTGPAGSGKTLLSLAYGLHAIVEERRFEKMIVARSTPPIAEDIGFLPGSEEEKMAPWLAAFDDNLEVLHGADESCSGSIEYVKEKANIQFKSLNFIRGRSFNNAFIIIDESQGLTQFQLKSIISRVGTNSRIVILGNLAQIDSKYITPLSSGLTYLVEKCKAFPHAGIMHVNGIERSRLAAFAEEEL